MHSKFLILFLLFLTSSQALMAEELVLGGSKVLSLLPMVAEQQGFYKEEGLTVRHEVISVGKLAMDAVLAGSVDVGVVVDTNLSFISFRENDLKVLATILRHVAHGLIECSSDFQLTAKEVRGKRIGYYPATTSHIFLVRWLQSLGLAMGDIQPIVLQPTAMGHAIKAGSVDAVSIWNPWRANIKNELGSQCEEVLGTPSLYPSYAYLAVKSSTLAKRGEDFSKLIRALIKAENFVREHEMEARTMYGSYTNMNLESVKSIWPYTEARVQLVPASSQIIEETIFWLSQNEPRFRGKAIFNQHDFFAVATLRSLDPARVELNQ